VGFRVEWVDPIFVLLEVGVDAEMQIVSPGFGRAEKAFSEDRLHLDAPTATTTSISSHYFIDRKHFPLA
jgi:hypothetical protein